MTFGRHRIFGKNTHPGLAYIYKQTRLANYNTQVYWLLVLKSMHRIIKIRLAYTRITLS